jgi:hypothetical protein
MSLAWETEVPGCCGRGEKCDRFPTSSPASNVHGACVLVTHGPGLCKEGRSSAQRGPGPRVRCDGGRHRRHHRHRGDPRLGMKGRRQSGREAGVWTPGHGRGISALKSSQGTGHFHRDTDVDVAVLSDVRIRLHGRPSAITIPATFTRVIPTGALFPHPFDSTGVELRASLLLGRRST